MGNRSSTAHTTGLEPPGVVASRALGLADKNGGVRRAWTARRAAVPSRRAGQTSGLR